MLHLVDLRDCQLSGGQEIRRPSKKNVSEGGYACSQTGRVSGNGNFQQTAGRPGSKGSRRLATRVGHFEGTAGAREGGIAASVSAVAGGLTARRHNVVYKKMVFYLGGGGGQLSARSG